MNIKRILTLSSLLFLISLLIISLTQPDKVQGFQTLEDVSYFAKKHTEDPLNTSQDPRKPDYREHIKRESKGVFEQSILSLLSFFGFVKMPWSVTSTGKLLDDLIETRKASVPSHSSIHKITPNKKSSFVIFGDLMGAFHSLSRNLQELHRLGIIDTTLHLTKNNFHLVFIGNVPGRSPYCMATLSLVLQLLKNNPDNVIYLKGSLENNEQWKKYGLATELKLRASDRVDESDSKAIPFEESLNTFFATLPLALYLRTEARGIVEFIRISSSSKPISAFLEEKKYLSFLLKEQKEKIETLALDTYKQKITPRIRKNFRGIITSKKKREKYALLEGLRIIPSKKSGIIWSILSCPTVPYQDALHFQTDSFAILTCKGSQIKDWTIDHYAQDVMLKDGYTHRSFYFINGVPVTKDTEPDMQADKEDSGHYEYVNPLQFKQEITEKRERRTDKLAAKKKDKT